MGHYESTAKRKVHSIKKEEKTHTSDLTAHLKALEQKKQTHPGGGDDRK